MILILVAVLLSLARWLLRFKVLLLIGLVVFAIVAAGKVGCLPWGPVDRSLEAQKDRWPETKERLIIEDGEIKGITRQGD